MMMTKAIAFAMLLTISGAAAADLNAPINNTPTIGSELQRGVAAAFDCHLKFVSDTSRQSQCALDAASVDQQRHPDFKPFHLGVFWGMWMEWGFDIQSDRSIAGTNTFAAARLPELIRERETYLPLFRRIQREVGVTDEQLVNAQQAMLPAAKAKLLEDLRQNPAP